MKRENRRAAEVRRVFGEQNEGMGSGAIDLHGLRQHEFAQYLAPRVDELRDGVLRLRCVRA